MAQSPISDPTASDTAQALADVSAILHDLRAPLGGIDAMVELLSQTQLDREQDKLVSALQAASRHLRAVADSVLGNATAASCASTLEDQIQAIADAARARCKARGLAFHLNVASDLPTTSAMPATHVRRVLENLIDNAIKATPSGAITLEIARKGDTVSIRISDTGPGMSDAQQRQLLGSSLHATPDLASRKGLGLTVIHQLVNDCGGKVTCASDITKGTSIGILLPVSAPKAQASGGRPRVLIVDDHPVNRQILSVMLHHFGCDHLEAASGEEALRLLEKEAVALVLLDEILPGLSGLETLRQIRRAHAMPVFATTGQVSTDLKYAYAAAGSTGFIEKPLTAEAVKSALATARIFTDKTQRAA